jgi:hypothetical protein
MNADERLEPLPSMSCVPTLSARKPIDQILAERRPSRRDKRALADPHQLRRQRLLGFFLIADKGEAVLSSLPIRTFGAWYKRAPYIASVLDAAFS